MVQVVWCYSSLCACQEFVSVLRAEALPKAGYALVIFIFLKTQRKSYAFKVQNKKNTVMGSISPDIKRLLKGKATCISLLNTYWCYYVE